ncbi:UNC-like C-terminal-domain-containing protein [Scheffersomyces coipomensis]|uniref:UNC-like C-terminal-domain-containing protein n=1 Tax=Scheffersomyces coipomensis TaxID=1788519 RepID=UPI00315D60E0
MITRTLVIVSHLIIYILSLHSGNTVAETSIGINTIANDHSSASSVSSSSYTSYTTFSNIPSSSSSDDSNTISISSHSEVSHSTSTTSSSTSITSESSIISSNTPLSSKSSESSITYTESTRSTPVQESSVLLSSSSPSSSLTSSSSSSPNTVSYNTIISVSSSVSNSVSSPVSVLSSSLQNSSNTHTIKSSSQASASKNTTNSSISNSSSVSNSSSLKSKSFSSSEVSSVHSSIPISSNTVQSSAGSSSTSSSVISSNSSVVSGNDVSSIKTNVENPPPNKVSPELDEIIESSSINSKTPEKVESSTKSAATPVKVVSIEYLTVPEPSVESKIELIDKKDAKLGEDISIGSNSKKYDTNETLRSATSLNVSKGNDLKNVSQSSINQTDIIDECHFMSFEEWKKNKEESGIIDQISSLNNSKSKSIEIPKNKTLPKEGNNKSSNLTKEQSNHSTYVNITLDDQEGKVYKDRFNYASVDCAATIVKSNSEAKGASSILVENKDSYLLNQCSSPNKFVVIELCEDILVESVVMGNFEFFSSMFKDIKVSVSDRFPTTNWKVLGEFEAQNVRDIQSFKIDNPLIWARYLKLEILSHYGSEFYCPISLVRVHGKTMMEEFKEEEAEKERLEQEQEQEIVVHTQAIEEMTNEKLSEECRVILPHLDLNNFLQELNSTNQYCEVISVSEPEPSSQIAQTKTEESIYKNIMKRLSLLESNATLSLLYIEEQSKLLSTAFSNLERRQSNNFESLIESVNSTIYDQLLNFKSSYMNLHKDYTKLFKLQESHHDALLKETKSKMASIGTELTFQKRVTIFNSVIIICLLVYVIVTRDVYGEQIAEVNDKAQSTHKQISVPRARSTGVLVPKVKQHVRSKKKHS